jgi:EpsI family protein
VNRRQLLSLGLGAAMVAAAGLAVVLTPRQRMAGAGPRFMLETMIPSTFGAWRIDPGIVPLQPDPAQQGMLERLYDQTLSRTYMNGDGERVMLSIAYGGDQSRALQLHLPEICYTAQGFEMLAAGDASLATAYGALPVKRLVARLNARNEPITYWITIGGKPTAPGVRQKLQRLAYGLSGRIPDGMLVRVSTIQADAASAYRLQDRFVGALLASLSTGGRQRQIGAGTPAAGAAPLATAPRTGDAPWAN